MNRPISLVSLLLASCAAELSSTDHQALDAGADGSVADGSIPALDRVSRVEGPTSSGAHRAASRLPAARPSIAQPSDRAPTEGPALSVHTRASSPVAAVQRSAAARFEPVSDRIEVSSRFRAHRCHVVVRLHRPEGPITARLREPIGMNHHTQCRYSVVPGSAHQLDADGDGRDEIYVAFVRMPDEHWASRQRRWFAVVPDARSRRVAELRPVPSVLFWNGNHVLLHGIDDPLRRVAANVLATGRPQPRAPRVDAGPCGDWNDYEVDVDGDGRVERLLLRTSGWEECQGHDDTLWLGDGRGRSTLIGTVSVDAFSGYRPGPTIELDAIGSRLARLDQCAVCDDELSMIELDAPRGGEARRGLATRRLSKHVRRMDEDTDRLLRRLAR